MFRKIIGDVVQGLVGLTKAIVVGSILAATIAFAAVPPSGAPAIGSTSDAACGTATGTCSLISLHKYLNNLAGTASNIAAGTTGGCSPFHGFATASTNSTNVKASAGTLCSLTLTNTTATLYYLRLYDSASAPTCSSATGATHSYPIPASTTGAGLQVNLGTFGEAYANGIGFCVTGGNADTDNTNAATGVAWNGNYK